MVPAIRRRFEDDLLVSESSPAMRIRVEGSLRYVAASTLELQGIALAERHHFVDAAEGRVRRMLVVQFEGFLPSSEETYRYALPDPVTLGGEDYGTWVVKCSLAEEIGRRPDAELADTVRVLAGHGLELDDEQIFARLARIVGDDRRHEVLIFYHEPRRDLAGPEQELMTRALATFEVV